jgi:hypothetical protein
MENFKISVIPAQAGIQQDKHSAKRTRLGLCPVTRGLFNLLDSRLRGNDEFMCPMGKFE